MFRISHFMRLLADAERIDLDIVDVPHAHAVGGVAEPVVVGHGADTAHDAGVEQRTETLAHRLAADAEHRADRLVGAGDERQAGLRGGDEGTVELRQHGRAAPRPPA
jgi:hypothetical protein